MVKDKAWGPFDPYDAFSETGDWYPLKYLAVDQGTIPVKIENYRSGLLWKLYMSCPEKQNGLKNLDFKDHGSKNNDERILFGGFF